MAEKRTQPNEEPSLSTPLVLPSDQLRLIDDYTFHMLAVMGYHPQQNGIRPFSAILLRNWIECFARVRVPLGLVLLAWRRWFEAGYLEEVGRGPQCSPDLITGELRPAPVDPPSFDHMPTDKFVEILKKAERSGMATLILCGPGAAFQPETLIPFPSMQFEFSDERTRRATVTIASDSSSRIAHFDVQAGKTRFTDDEKALVVLAAAAVDWPLDDLAKARDVLVISMRGTKRGRPAFTQNFDGSVPRGVMVSLRRQLKGLDKKLPFLLTVENSTARPGTGLRILRIREVVDGTDRAIGIEELRQRFEQNGIRVPTGALPEKHRAQRTREASERVLGLPGAPSLSPKDYMV